METYNRELSRIRSLLKGSTKGLTVTEISRNIGINRNSVAKYLDVLLTSGQVEMKAVGSAKIFSLAKRIPISSILSLSSDYILILDNEFIITYANENVLNFEQKTYDELVGKSVESLPVTFFSVHEIQNLLKEALSGKETIRELDIKKGDRSYCFRAKFVPSILENGKKGLLLMLEDISETKQYQINLEKTVAEREKELTTSYKDLNNVRKSQQEIKDAFEESERRYHNLIELAQAGVWSFDGNGVTTFVNQTMAKMLGYSQRDMKEKTLFSCTDETNREILLSHLDALKTGQNRFFELTFTKKDGSPAYARISASPSMDEAGLFRYGLFVVSDISELKKIDDALQESERNYRTIIETSPNGIILFDHDGLIRMGNIRAAKMLGYKFSKDLNGKNLFNYISPSDFEKSKELIQNAIESGYSKSFECSLISRDNSAFCAEISLSAIPDRNNLPSGFVSIISDITERRRAEYQLRKSEEKHRSLIEQISQTIFTIDKRGKFTYISPAINRILGYTPDELIGKHFYTLVPSEERHTLGNELKEAESGQNRQTDFKMIDKSGNPRWVRILVQPLRENNNLMGITGLIGDINDWKQTENALQQCKLIYKAVVEDQTDLICRFHPDFTISFVNRAFYRYYRKKEEELINQSYLSLIPDKQQHKIKKIIGELTPEAPVRTFEEEITNADGDRRWYHATIRRLFNEAGKTLEYQSSWRDITELRLYFERSHALLQELQVRQTELETRNEELIRLRQISEQSERKYLDLYNLAPAGYLTLNEEGQIIELNQTGSHLMGLGREQLINRKFTDFVSDEYIEEFLEFFNKIISTAKKHTCEISLKQQDNTVITIQIEGQAIKGTDEKPRQCRIILIDITDRKLAEQALKESERRLKAIIQGSPTPQFVIDKNHNVIYWNKAMTLSTGIKASDVVGTNLQWKAYYPEPRPCLADLLVDDAPEKIPEWYPAGSTKSRISAGAYETLDFYPRLGHGGKWLYMTATVIRDTNNVIIGALETIEDITEIKRAEETIKNANRKLGTLTRITHHDISNQITAWAGYMELMEASIPDKPEIKKYAEKAKAAVMDAKRLMSFARDYQSLGIEMAGWQNLEKVIYTAVKSVNPTDIRLNVSTGSIEVYADPLIEKVFYNLIDNSIRHGDHVSNISFSFNEQNGSGIIIYEDDGVGIPAPMKNKLFRKGFGKNTGFGLYLSKEILNYTGISINETGEENRGARFEIIIPKNLYRKNQPDKPSLEDHSGQG